MVDYDDFIGCTYDLRIYYRDSAGASDVHECKVYSFSHRGAMRKATTYIQSLLKKPEVSSISAAFLSNGVDWKVARMYDFNSRPVVPWTSSKSDSE